MTAYILFRYQNRTIYPGQDSGVSKLLGITREWCQKPARTTSERSDIGPHGMGLNEGPVAKECHVQACWFYENGYALVSTKIQVRDVRYVLCISSDQTRHTHADSRGILSTRRHHSHVITVPWFGSSRTISKSCGSVVVRARSAATGRPYRMGYARTATESSGIVWHGEGGR